MEKWYDHSAVNGDVVISSRIRLARNLSNVFFQSRLSEKDAADLVHKVREQTSFLEQKEEQSFYSCNVSKLSENSKGSMVEWHIISPLLANKKQDTGLIVSEDESISIMINEEDHIRIQSVLAGMDIKKAFENADRIDDLLSEVLPFAFHEKYGYLTTCPTNIGTGMRASYMLFLPALTIEKKIQALADEISKYGITIRGVYGEGSKSYAYMYQVSNQKTVGSSESDIIQGLNEIVMQIIKQERKRREYILSVNELEVTDQIYRSYGLLKYAKKLSAEDTMTLLAQVKLGVDMGILNMKEKSDFHRLMMEIQPASLQKCYGKNLGKGERERYRALYINEKLPELV